MQVNIGPAIKCSKLVLVAVTVTINYNLPGHYTVYPGIKVPFWTVFVTMYQATQHHIPEKGFFESYYDLFCQNIKTNPSTAWSTWSSPMNSFASFNSSTHVHKLCWVNRSRTFSHHTKQKFQCQILMQKWHVPIWLTLILTCIQLQKHIKNFKMCTLYISLIEPKFTSFWRHSLMSQWTLQVWKFQHNVHTNNTILHLALFKSVYVAIKKHIY